jgi:hypothetical protein
VIAKMDSAFKSCNEKKFRDTNKISEKYHTYSGCKNASPMTSLRVEWLLQVKKYEKKFTMTRPFLSAYGNI